MALRFHFHLPLHPPGHLETKYIRLDARKCKACWQCVQSCPNHALGKAILFRHRHAHVDHAEDCKGCKKCIRVCDSNAISYKVQPPITNENVRLVT